MASDCSRNTTGLAFSATQEFLVTYYLTFVFFILFVVPFRVHFVDISWKLLRLHIFTGIFVKSFCAWNIIIGFYRAAHECEHFQAPVPKLQMDKCTQDQQLLQSVPPPKDKYLEEAQPRQTLVIEDDSSLLAPSSINEPEHKKPWYQWKGQNPQQKQPLQEIHSSAKLRPYWVSHPASIPSFRTEIRQKI